MFQVEFLSILRVKQKNKLSWDFVVFSQEEKRWKGESTPPPKKDDRIYHCSIRKPAKSVCY